MRDKTSTRPLLVIYIFSCHSFLFAQLFFLQPGLAQSSDRAALTLTITGLRSEKGQVKVAVFNSPEKWLGEEPVYSATVAVNAKTVTWKLNEIAHGEYGIAVFHDENKNGKMDKNFVGIPLEPYGFSNNVRVTFGPPKWERAKFVVKGAAVEIEIEVK